MTLRTETERPLEILYCLPALYGFDGYSMLAADVFDVLVAAGHTVDCAVLQEANAIAPANDRFKEARHAAFHRHPAAEGGLRRLGYRVGNRLQPRRVGGRHFCPPGYLRMVRSEFPLARYDAVIAAGARFAGITEFVTAPVICDLHELFSHKAEVLARHGIPFLAPFASLDEEIAALARFDILWCPSRYTRDVLQLALPGHIFLDRHLSFTPLLADGDLPPIPEAAAPGRLLFVGSTAAENRPGLALFLREIWPTIRGAVPAVELHVVGWKREDFPVGCDLRGVVPHGRVPTRAELLRHYAEANVVVIPRFLGGLTIKGVEALVLGKATVGHPLAFSGCYEIAHGREAFIAERSSDFAQAVVRLLREPELRARVGANARRFARTAFAPARVYEGLIATIGEARRGAATTAGRQHVSAHPASHDVHGT